jgi:hypothetical protein
MRIRAVLIVLTQSFISIWVAFYVVSHSVSYVGFGPPGPWWTRVLKWPLHLVVGLVGLRLGMVMLLIMYSGIVFLVLQCGIVRPILRNRLN